MYGLVNKAIRDMIVKNHGLDKWGQICALSDFNDQDFLAMSSYPDKLTYVLVENTAKVLNLNTSEVLEAFGEYWILFTANEGYSDLMTLTGSSFPIFLSNLDMLHNRISNIMPKLVAPQFSTHNLTDNSIELEYRSQRQGFTPMLIGILRGLGKRFQLEVKISHIRKKNHENVCDTFLITW